MAEIVRIHQHLPPSVAFRWRDKLGNDHEPRRMETAHVFYTIRMIWNYSVPKIAQTPGNTKRYWFGPFHTPEYLARAVHNLAWELQRRPRSEFKQEWLDDLNWIRGWVQAQECEEVVFLSEIRKLEHHG